MTHFMQINWALVTLVEYYYDPHFTTGITTGMSCEADQDIINAH